MKLRRLGVVLVAAAAATLATTVVSAQALPPHQPSAAFSGQLVAGSGSATVRISYTCYSNASPINHLFVAIKQGPLVDTSEHSSSQYADTFYSTNWLSDAGPNALICNGKPHLQIIVLKPQPGFQPAVKKFHSGPVLVQICVYDNVTAFGPYGEPLDGGFAPSYTMQNLFAG